MNSQIACDDLDGRTIYNYPEQPQMQVEVILASRSTVEGCPPIYTIRMRYPRIIHGEIMTHRVFSRNARSSRAVPVKTMLDEVRNMPFIPWHWGKNQKGMQAGEECDELVSSKSIPMEYDWADLSREQAWRSAAEVAVGHAEAFMEAGYHKQIVNRLIEPFSWIDTLITATDWNNFLWLRNHKDAEPHLQDLARLVKAAIEDAEVQTLEPGEWHLPYITEEDIHELGTWNAVNKPAFAKLLCKISAARCARISYKPFDGDASYERELERYEMLVTSDRVHASPTEHQAAPDRMLSLGISDWKGSWENPHLHGNFYGWIQARKLILNERYTPQ